MGHLRIVWKGFGTAPGPPEGRGHLGLEWSCLPDALDLSYVSFPISTVPSGWKVSNSTVLSLLTLEDSVWHASQDSLGLWLSIYAPTWKVPCRSRMSSAVPHPVLVAAAGSLSHIPPTWVTAPGHHLPFLQLGWGTGHCPFHLVACPLSLYFSKILQIYFDYLLGTAIYYPKKIFHT